MRRTMSGSIYTRKNRMGFSDVRYIKTSEMIFGSERRADMMMLGNSGMLVGKK